MYLDVLWLLNFIVDFLLLIASNRLSGYRTQWGRTILGSLIGGFYGCMCVLPGLFFLASTFWRLVVLTMIGIVAFGAKKDAVRRCVLFVILCMALGGIALGIGTSGFLSVLFCAVMVSLMCIFGLRGRIGDQFIPIQIKNNGKTHYFTALIDTGNMLTDPMTGEQIIVVSSKLGEQILGQGSVSFSDPISAVAQIEGGRLVPYHSIGTENGLLAAKRFQYVKIGQRCGACLVAFSPRDLGKGQSYEALTGGNVWG